MAMPTATHLIVILPGGQRVDTWTQDPAGLERRYRESGAYVMPGGEPQPVREGDPNYLGPLTR